MTKREKAILIKELIKSEEHMMSPEIYWQDGRFMEDHRWMTEVKRINIVLEKLIKSIEVSDG